MKTNLKDDLSLLSLALFVLSVSLSSLMFCGCETTVAPAVSIDGLVNLNEPERGPEVKDQAPQDARVIDARISMIEDQAPVIEMDMEMTPELDMRPELLPDGEVPNGPPCDPRLRGAVCEPGFSCVPVPSGRVNDGRCVEGDQCSLIGESGCPESAPYCHLFGRGTRCTQAGMRNEGDVCLDEFNRALPCAEGLICNFSICVSPCDPRLPNEEACVDGRQCVDISNSIGQPGGFCGPRGTCDLLTNEGCNADEQCAFSVRADDRQIVYFCTTRGTQSVGEDCVTNQMGQNNCGPGLVCIGPGGGTQECRMLCDTGAYQISCPPNQACREILREGGVNIQGIGLCIINP